MDRLFIDHFHATTQKMSDIQRLIFAVLMALTVISIQITLMLGVLTLSESNPSQLPYDALYAMSLDAVLILIPSLGILYLLNSDPPGTAGKD